ASIAVGRTGLAAREREVDEQAVRAVRPDRADGLEVDGNDARAVLAGRLGKELFGPRPEARDGRIGQERQLVAAGLREATEREAEQLARVAACVRRPARVE